MIKRYCKQCKTETLHDKINDNMGGNSLAGRAFWGIFSLGLSEIVTDYWFKCQRCDKTTKKS